TRVFCQERIGIDRVRPRGRAVRAAAGARGPPSAPLPSAPPPGVLSPAVPSRAAATAITLHEPPVSPAGYGASRLPAGGPPRVWLALRGWGRPATLARRAVTSPRCRSTSLPARGGRRAGARKGTGHPRVDRW